MIKAGRAQERHKRAQRLQRTELHLLRLKQEPTVVHTAQDLTSSVGSRLPLEKELQIQRARVVFLQRALCTLL